MKAWTKAGRLRLSQQIVELDARIKNDIATNVQHEQVAGSLNEEKLLERATDIAAHQVHVERLKDLSNLFESTEDAPKPKGSLKIQVGHKVEYEIVDCLRGRNAGMHRSVILGGPEEADLDSPLPTISLLSPLGKALYGAKVDAIVEVRLLANEYSIKIHAISIPDVPNLKMVSAA